MNGIIVNIHCLLRETVQNRKGKCFFKLTYMR